jgi:hypothetical protein
LFEGHNAPRLNDDFLDEELFQDADTNRSLILATLPVEKSASMRERA